MIHFRLQGNSIGFMNALILNQIIYMIQEKKKLIEQKMLLALYIPLCICNIYIAYIAFVIQQQ